MQFHDILMRLEARTEFRQSKHQRVILFSQNMAGTCQCSYAKFSIYLEGTHKKRSDDCTFLIPTNELQFSFDFGR